MLPELLKLKNFLSYKEEEKLDFRNFHIALLSGENGQGKSSILDAITFALFSKARGVEDNKKGMEDLVSAGRDNLKVVFQFIQNNNRYRITRMYNKIRGKSDVLLEIEDNGRFVNISSNKIRETDAKIAKIIGMDYDAFVTSSFILQGKSDFFTAKNPREKMEILREMLGLNIYEEARERALNERREKKVLKEELLKEIENTRALLKSKETVEKNLQLKKEEIRILQNKKEEEEEKNKKLLNLLNELEKMERERNYLAKRKEELEEHMKAKEAEINREKEKLLEIEKILAKKDEIVQGYDEYVKNTSLYNKLLRKKVEVSELKRKKEGIKIKISKEIELKQSRQRELQERIEESESFIENNSSELENEQVVSKDLFERKNTLEKKEEIITDKISLLEEKVKKLSESVRAKINIEGEIKKLEGIENERMENAKRNGEQLEKELKQIETILDNIKIKEDRKIVKEIEYKIKKLSIEIESKKNKLSELNEKKILLINQIKITKKTLEEIKEKSRIFAEGTDRCPLCGSLLTEEHKQKVKLAYEKDIQKEEALLSQSNKNLSAISEEILHIDVDSMEKELRSLQEKREHYLSELHNKEAIFYEKTKQRDEILSRIKEIESNLKEGVLTSQEKTRLNELKYKLSYFDDVEKEKETTENLLKEDEVNLQRLQRELSKINSLYAVSENKIKKLKKDITEHKRKIEQYKIELQKIKKLLQDPTFLKTEREQILQIERSLKEINFDEEVFKQCEQKVKKLNKFETLFLNLQKAKAHKEEVEKHISSLENELELIRKDLEKSLQKMKEVSDAIEKMGNVREKYDASEKALKMIYKEYQNERDEMIRLEEEYKKLKEAESSLKEKLQEEKRLEHEERILNVCVNMFGKEGIQNLIIKSVLPQIEDISNDILKRMSGGTMQLKFNTVKTTSKGEKRNTLEIDVYDNGARRRYALFSGGEQFRINLAIRIGISLFLASLHGKPLELLIIDEGFGSQDESGRVRILEELDSVKDQFKKVLIITHISEVKESFPYELRVTKDQRGSHIYVV